MNSCEYLKYIEEKLCSFFTFEKNKNVLNYQYDMFGENKSTLGRTLITQVDVIDKYQVNEYLLIKSYDSMDLKELNLILVDVKEIANSEIEIKEDHKLSTISLILLINDDIEEDCIKKIKKFNYTKLYNFYLKGYCELRVMSLCFSNATYAYSKSFKNTQKVFTNILSS